MINDLYAVTHIDLHSDEGRDDLRRMFSAYYTLGVRKLHLAHSYDPSLTVASYFAKNKNYFDSLQKLPRSGLKVSYIHTVPLVKGISKHADLERLAVKNGVQEFIYITLSPYISADDAISELHGLLYNCHLTPIIVSYQLCRYYLPEKLISALLNIPGAIYQIDLHSLAERSVRSLVRTMIIQNKTVIFGSGDKFDALLHINMPYYTKLLRSSLGENVYGYYILQHNKLF